ncbi:hypothetical protein [Pelosinus baikalensis]|uniref:PsbP C-terminal domain-containing protein n=1 Tax=Pelosinus baikalensis TaxID=2892015 RepID=A0ABS8I1D5_9FIRM|nr:hypothetical protein [Pelosinus baikalensis]MCC5468518.1 hypothetical protein [Pelosinus baikalensis]
MKKIPLIVLAFLFLLSTTVFAQNFTSYAMSDYLSVSLPTNWDTKLFDTGILSHRSDFHFSASLYVKPRTEESLDDLAIKLEKGALNINEISNLTWSVEDKGALLIDHYDSRFMLHHYSGPSLQKPQYQLHYFLYSNGYQYDIHIIGEYDNLKTDHETIDKIISSVKIIK